MKVLLLAALLASGSGSAEAQSLPFSIDATDACVAGASDWLTGRSCVGKSSGTCMKASPDGMSTAGMLDCIGAEHSVWDDRLNQAYRAALSAGEPTAADALRSAQRAWIAWRDAECAYHGADLGGGSASGLAYNGCIMRLTGERALELGWEMTR